MCADEGLYIGHAFSMNVKKSSKNIVNVLQQLIEKGSRVIAISA